MVRSGGIALVTVAVAVIAMVVTTMAASPVPGAASPVPGAETAETPSPIWALDVAFTDDRHGLVVGSSSNGPDAQGIIWRTNDGGGTWASSLTGSAPIETIDAVGPSFLMASTMCRDWEQVGCHGAVLISNDGGTTWATVGNASILSLTLTDERHGWAIDGLYGSWGTGVQPGPLLRTDDGGQTWALQDRVCARGMEPIAVSFVDPRHGWLACLGEAGTAMAPKTILATRDGGRSWSVRANAGWRGTGVGSIPMVGVLEGMSMAKGGHGLTWSVYNTPRTTDGGRTWHEVRGFGSAMSMVAASLIDGAWYALTWSGDSGQQLLVSRDRRCHVVDIGDRPVSDSRGRALAPGRGVTFG